MLFVSIVTSNLGSREFSPINSHSLAVSEIRISFYSTIGSRSVNWIHDVRSFDLRVGRVDPTEEQARNYGDEEQDDANARDLPDEQKAFHSVATPDLGAGRPGGRISSSETVSSVAAERQTSHTLNKFV